MAASDAAHVAFDTGVRERVAPLSMRYPHVLKARLTRPVFVYSVQYDANHQDFWLHMMNTYGVSPVTITECHNRLRLDARIEGLVSETEHSGLREVGLERIGPVPTGNRRDERPVALRNVDASRLVALEDNQLLLFESSIDLPNDQVRYMRLVDEFEPMIDSSVYLAVETMDSENEILQVSLRMGEENFDSLARDGSLNVEHNGNRTNLLNIKVGEFSTHSDYAHIVNRGEYTNMAIVKIELIDQNNGKSVLNGEFSSLKWDIRALLDDHTRPAHDRGFAKLYLHVDAHTKHSRKIKPEKVNYCGGRNSGQTFWKGDAFANSQEFDYSWICLRLGWVDPVTNPKRLLYGSEGYRPIAGAFGGRIRWRPGEGPWPHQGVDVFAPLGTPLYSCVDGTVVDVVNNGNDNFNARNPDLDWYHRDKYGNYVIIELDNPLDLFWVRNSKYELNRRDLYLLEPGLGEAPVAADAPETAVPAHRLPRSARRPTAEAGFENNKLLEVEHGRYWHESETRFLFYGHMREVHVGLGPVKSGQLIGTSGKSGNASNIRLQSNRHLHFEVRNRMTPRPSDDMNNRTNNRTNPAYYLNWDSLDPSQKVDEQRGKRDPNPVPLIQPDWEGNVAATDARIALMQNHVVV